MPPTGAPIVVSGPSRSGTTWMQTFLSSHPDLHIHGQLPARLPWEKIWDFYLDAREAGLKSLIDNRTIGLETPHYCGSPPERTRELFGQFLRDFAAGHAADGVNGKPRWGIKWVSLCTHPEQVAQVEAIWPDARWIVCLRDPFATAESFVNTYAPDSSDATIQVHLSSWVRAAKFAREERPSVHGFLLDRVGVLTASERQAATAVILRHVGLSASSETTGFIDRWPTVHKALPDEKRKFQLSDDDRKRLLDVVPGLAEYTRRLGYPVP